MEMVVCYRKASARGMASADNDKEGEGMQRETGMASGRRTEAFRREFT